MSRYSVRWELEHLWRQSISNILILFATVRQPQIKLNLLVHSYILTVNFCKQRLKRVNIELLHVLSNQRDNLSSIQIAKFIPTNLLWPVPQSC
jgi:hypothetical protein